MKVTIRPDISAVIFHEEAHPDYQWFKQCVTFKFFPSETHELIYNLFTMFAMYGLPLLVITLSYALILREISKKTQQSREEMQELNSSKAGSRLRRSAVGNIERARAKTLKMTFIIVGVFVFCWTPYYVISVWWWFDRETAKDVDPRIQKGLFMFAVSNSCVNPIVYGLFTINFKREFMRCCCCLKSKWRNAKRSLHTGGTQMQDGRSLYSRTSHSSIRASTTTTVTYKIKMERGPCGDPLLRFIARGDSQCQSNGSLTKSSSDRSIQQRDTRHNSNNFLVIHMKDQDEFE